MAPNHQKIKAVTATYEKVAADPRVRFFGNVKLGRDLSVEDLRARYDQIVYAVGCESDRPMGIPGEALDGSFAATDLVGWYNGHPDHRLHRFDLSCEAVAIVGMGNVAMDVARILTQDAELLARTDAASYAVEALRNSRIKRVYLLGRRGPVQAAFSPREIEEIGEIERPSLTVTNEDLVLDEVSKSGLIDPRVKKNYEYLSMVARSSTGAKDRRIVLRFCVSPVALIGSAGHVEAIALERNELIPDGHGGVTARGTGRWETLDGIGLVFRAVGYRGIPIPGVTFDDHAGHIANGEGRVAAANAVVPGDYGAYFRSLMPVDPTLPHPPGIRAGTRLDPLVCALAIKASTTKRAVLVLCELCDGDNAVALARVLLENAFFRWGGVLGALDLRRMYRDLAGAPAWTPIRIAVTTGGARRMTAGATISVITN